MTAYGRPYYQSDEPRRRQSTIFDEEAAAIDLCFWLPRHPAVAAYKAELATRNSHRDRSADLRTARRHFKAARDDYEKRCGLRCRRDVEWSDGGKFVSLRAILEARAEAMYWFGIVEELERVEEAKERREWIRRAAVKRRLRSMGLAC